MIHSLLLALTLLCGGASASALRTAPGARAAHPVSLMAARLDGIDAAGVRALMSDASAGAEFVRLAAAEPAALQDAALRAEAVAAVGEETVTRLEAGGKALHARLGEDAQLAAAVAALRGAAVSPKAAVDSLGRVRDEVASWIKQNEAVPSAPADAAPQAPASLEKPTALAAVKRPIAIDKPQAKAFLSTLAVTSAPGALALDLTLKEIIAFVHPAMAGPLPLFALIAAVAVAAVAMSMALSYGRARGAGRPFDHGYAGSLLRGVAWGALLPTLFLASLTALAVGSPQVIFLMAPLFIAPAAAFFHGFLHREAAKRAAGAQSRNTDLMSGAAVWFGVSALYSMNALVGLLAVALVAALAFMAKTASMETKLTLTRAAGWGVLWSALPAMAMGAAGAVLLTDGVVGGILAALVMIGIVAIPAALAFLPYWMLRRKN